MSHPRPWLPARLEKLRALAQNLYWTWHEDVRELFARVDAELLQKARGNPIELLATVHPDRLEELERDDAFMRDLHAAHAGFVRYMGDEGWFARTHPSRRGDRYAYFSMEYGLHESLPIYSGGLGVLAGDHLKTASDLGVPLVAVGLAYAHGYFQQVLLADGSQHEQYPANDWSKLPVSRVSLPGGAPLTIQIAMPTGVVHASVWRVAVGRVDLLLLDTNVPENSLRDRETTAALYSGDTDLRIRQEILLGVGGIHALFALGLDPAVCHMNEGHSAFLAFERIRRMMDAHGIPFDTARLVASAGSVFTTHTPVPAGNDVFDPESVHPYLRPYEAALGLDGAELRALGQPRGEARPAFSMPVLALRTSHRRNGVSRLHGDVSREMYRGEWPELAADEVPIGAVTNGVHAASWIAPELHALYTRYLGAGWTEHIDDAHFQGIHEIPDGELFETHARLRRRLVQEVRRWLERSAIRQGGSERELSAARTALDPDALTIGFARRFATYKRATLLFLDLERLARLLGDRDRPVQLVFAGKAHPQDAEGKAFIREIVQRSREGWLDGRVVFLEDYDMGMARSLVSGVDVWLNTPRRPHEASGTSGMKAAANGVLNLSVLDGWWAEAYEEFGSRVGWAIVPADEGTDPDDADLVEARRLYDLLEHEVIPAFHAREGGTPAAWTRKMKHSMASLTPRFSATRMVRDYATRFYVPAAVEAEEIVSRGRRGRPAHPEHQGAQLGATT